MVYMYLYGTCVLTKGGKWRELRIQHAFGVSILDTVYIGTQ